MAWSSVTCTAGAEAPRPFVPSSGRVRQGVAAAGALPQICALAPCAVICYDQTITPTIRSYAWLSCRRVGRFTLNILLCTAYSVARGCSRSCDFMWLGFRRTASCLQSVVCAMFVEVERELLTVDSIYSCSLRASALPRRRPNNLHWTMPPLHKKGFRKFFPGGVFGSRSPKFIGIRWERN